MKTTIFRKYTMVFILVGLMILFSLLSPAFLTAYNLRNIVVQNTHILVVAVGISFLMMSGALDLSVGYQMSVIGVLAAKLMTEAGASPVVAVLCAILAGVACGFINGFLANLLKIQPLVVTIGTTTVFQGISYLISQGRAYSNYPETFRLISKGAPLGVPSDVWIAIAALLIAAFVFNFTYFGRYVKAMGGNEEAARLAGVNTKRMRLATFMISGFFVSIATFILISKQGTTNSSVGPGTELTAMTAAMLGGISFSSGEGKMWGLLVGVYVLGIIENGMQLAGWNQYIQYIVKGLVLLAAIGFDQYQRSSQTKKKPVESKKAEAA